MVVRRFHLLLLLLLGVKFVHGVCFLQIVKVLARIVCSIVVTALLVMELILVVDVGLLIVHIKGTHALIDGRVVKVRKPQGLLLKTTMHLIFVLHWLGCYS